jgi:hypothetical protein
VPKEMRRRDVERALRSEGCQPKTASGRGSHDKWVCPCGGHTANIPRHTHISPGVVADTIQRLACLPKGWLQ